MTKQRFQVLIAQNLPRDELVFVYRFDKSVTQSFKLRNQVVSAMMAGSQAALDDLREQVYAIAAIANVDRNELLKATAKNLMSCAGSPRLFTSKKPQAWNGDVFAPPTEEEVRRAWRELGLE
jgi:hypothetical protein